jgi:hypothetical protein
LRPLILREPLRFCKSRRLVNLPRPLIATALAALLTTLAVACGDDDDDASDATVPGTSAPSGSVPSDCPPEPTEESAADLVGLTEADATDAAEACGWILRVVRRDGEDQPATRDFRPNRVNVEVTDGEVTAIVNTG